MQEQVFSTVRSSRTLVFPFDKSVGTIKYAPPRFACFEHITTLHRLQLFLRLASKLDDVGGSERRRSRAYTHYSRSMADSTPTF